MSTIPQRYNFTLDYTPDDFFYLTNEQDMPKPSPTACEWLTYDPPKNCGSTTDQGNLKKCYEHQLCLNKQSVEQMYEKRNKHMGAGAKLLDFQNKHKYEIYTTWNLAMGVILAVSYIYFNR